MKRSDSGFTLIELMVAMAMSSIVVGVIYSAYTIQSKIYTEQGKVAEMQQNLRVGMAFLQREARMAGYNPGGTKDVSCDAQTGTPKKVAPGIHTATATSFGFSMDLNDDGDCSDTGENVTYSIYNDVDGIKNLGRAAPAVRQSIAENITQIDFVYLFQPPRVGSPVPFTSQPTDTPISTKLKDIVSVQVSLLAQAKQRDRKPAVATTYILPMPDAWGDAYNTTSSTWTTRTPPTWTATNDSYSRRVLTATVNCRNMGL